MQEISGSVLKKIKGIEIKTRRIVEDYFSGKYESVFKGTGMNFSDVREYQPGDDIRSIDWNVTARFGKPFIKQFVEERELTILLVVDVSASQFFASAEKTKAYLACEIASILAFSALASQDKVGLIMFSDGAEKYLPPRKNRQYVMRIIREILYYNAEKNKTDITKTLKFINDVYKRKAVVFLISDFIDENYEKILKITNKKHDLIAINIKDVREESIPNVGIIEIEDSETNNRIIINTSDSYLRKTYGEKMAKRDEYLKNLFGKAKIDSVNLKTNESYIKPLYTFFKQRESRK